MTLFKTTLWTGISTFFKAGLMYFMWKIIAIYTGPAGVAIVEQFQNFLQIVRTSVVCGISQAIVKYISEYKDNENKKTAILSSAIVLVFIICVIVSIILVGFSAKISQVILLTDVYANLIKLVAASMLLFALNSLGLAILNGELEVRQYIYCISANTVLNFFITSYLVVYHGLYGGLIGFVLNQSLVFIFTLYFVAKGKRFKLQSLVQGVDLGSVKKLVKYSLMTSSTAFIVHAALIVVRQYIAGTLLWEDAGYWQGIMRLSSGYIIIMNMVFGFYYLPKLSATKNREELKTEVIRSYQLLFPLILVSVLIIYIFREPIIILMYSREFLHMAALFKYQLIGDVARMGTWLLCNILLAKALVKTFIVCEIFFSITYIIFTTVFVHYFGLVGAALGFAVNYMLYWIFMICFSIWYTSGGEEFPANVPA